MLPSIVLQSSLGLMLSYPTPVAKVQQWMLQESGHSIKFEEDKGYEKSI